MHTEEFTFSTTPYKNNEDAILEIRNRNRETKQNRVYMDWRYLGGISSSTSPVVFWVQRADGTRIGMASIIYRPYWVNNKLVHFAVLGDISLNQELRGKGVGGKLFQFMNSYIGNKSHCCGFVIPNAAAQKSLSTTGWKTKELRFPFVYLINPTDKINSKFKIKFLAKVLGLLFSNLLWLKLSLYRTKNYKIEHVNNFDESFDLFWQSFSKQNIIIKDRSVSSLHWQYSNHPDIKFMIKKIIKNNKLVGYIIYTILEEYKDCSIYDFIVLEQSMIKPAMVLFFKWLCKGKITNTVRTHLNSNHPYSKMLLKVGFVRRKDIGVFQTYIPSNLNVSESLVWFTTQSDKDV